MHAVVQLLRSNSDTAAYPPYPLLSNREIV